MYIRWKLGIVFTQLKLEGISIPIFQRIQKTPNKGYSILLKFHLGMSPTRFLKKREFIAVGLKASDIEIERIKSNIYRLKVRKGSLSVLPENITAVEKHFLPRRTRSVPLGIDLDGYEVELPLFTDDGGTVSLIGGNPGQGKTSALKVIVSGLVDSDTSIFWFDPKNGADANPYRSRVNVVSSPLDPQPYIDTLASINRSIANRNAIVGKGGNIKMFPPIIVMVDEWAVLGSLGTKSQQQEFTQQLRRLVSTGRSTNISVVLSTQRPTSVSIDVATRELSGNRIAFLVGDEYASEAILGIKGAENQVNPLRKGQAIAWINGAVSRISLFRIPENLIVKCEEYCGLKTSEQDLFQLEQINAREMGIGL